MKTEPHRPSAFQYTLNFLYCSAFYIVVYITVNKLGQHMQKSS